MKKFIIICVFFLYQVHFLVATPQTIDELKKSFGFILQQEYDAKNYTWDFAFFDDMYKKNASVYKNSSYLASKEIFVPIFENINKKMPTIVGGKLNLLCKKDQKIVIIGSLYGGVQCLFDYVENMYKSGIITKEFLLQQNYSIVFLGNAVGRSPYSLETLAFIGLLKQKNSNNVFFIQGLQEYQEGWLDIALGDQLAAMGVVPLYKHVITNFFVHCPLALMITFDGTDRAVLCASSYVYALQYVTENVAIILSGLWDYDFAIHKHNTGFFLLPTINGATNWKVFSACTPLMEEYYNFSTYSYVILGQKTITHVYRNKNQKNYQQEAFDSYTGLPISR